MPKEKVDNEQIDIDILKVLFSEERDWEKIIVDLTVYSQKRISKITWYTGHGELPKGFQVEDFVSDAIVSVCSGKRKWDPTEKPDLLIHLKGIVKSKISHLLKSKEYKTTLAATEEDLDSAIRVGESRNVELTPEDILISKERNEELEDVLQELCDGDNELESLIVCLMDDVKPAEIAKQLSWSNTKVYRLRRKLKRRLVAKNLFNKTK